ncbi:NACHT domain-containing protein [Aeromicrobium choanae]|uniref:RanBP2-type domain-containing protein n=1 Tax=Aeromicrobium choanae TaxID=1736691 RepID=A0A1T4Z0U5_9ACTN|nr:hypothetical protein [Aeromicrobium choanae]SKB07680.1 hypothetical protein SAMN06295964_1780 [Aeromicrobium choanae]
MSSAGRANEAGSVFRRNAAVYFAVHALVGRPVDALDASTKILFIDFETPDATDDIVLGLTGGSRAFVSAKNHVDAGRPFKETVAGWVAQLSARVGPDDLLGLTFESCAAWVKDLAEGLRRLRAGQEIYRSVEIEALKRLDELVPVAQQDEVHRRARLLQVPGSPVSHDTQTVLRVLLANVVEGDPGSALSTLQSGLHSLAGSGLRADVPSLVAMLETAGGLSVRLDGGSPAATVAATEEALQKYLDSFLAQKGRVNLPLLAEDLGPVLIDGLYDSLRVIDSTQTGDRGSATALSQIVRRRRRALLVGQPGSGKSVATREIAAACAGHIDAPIPVLVHLPNLLPVVRDRDLGLADVLEAGALRGTQNTRGLLSAELTARAAFGDVLLVLDGLDECRSEAPLMADHLKRMIDGLHPDTGVVLATRASAEVPAERLGLPRLDLQRPNDLTSTMGKVLDECARVRVNEDIRSDWLDARRAWVREVRDAQAGLVEVPQLALLVVLIVAESSELNVPQERAELLHRAVVRSVERWELVRFAGPELAWALDLSPTMLLDGFQLLGRMLDTVDNISKAEALAGLTKLLVEDRWLLPSGRAKELAAQVLRFWDEHVSVFTIDDESGVLLSRSRVFTEVATAMWTTTCEASELQAWAVSALKYEDSHGVLGLAQGLNPELVQALLDLGEADPHASSAVAATAGNGTIELVEPDMRRLLAQLLQHFTAVDSGEIELGPRKHRSRSEILTKIAGKRRADSWPIVEAVCELPLPAALRAERRKFISTLPLPEPMKLLPNAWVVLTDAATEVRDLTGAEVELVQAAIDMELPDTPPLIRTSRRSVTVPTGTPTPFGLVPVALLAVRHLEHLAERSAEQIYEISMHGSMKDHARIDRALRATGITVSPWAKRRPWMNFLSRMAERDYEKQFLGDIAALHDSDTLPALTKLDRWSLRDLGDLVFAAGYATVGVGEFDTAFILDSHELRTKWLQCVALGYGVDIPAAAAQAQYVLNQPAPGDELPHDWWTVTVRPAYVRDSVAPDALTAEQQHSLIEALGAHSDWIAWSAANLLAQTTARWDPDSFFEADRSRWKPQRAMLFHVVAILVSANGTDLLRRAAASEDPAYRQAAEMAVRVSSELDTDGEIARKLSVDDDLTVRGTLDAGEPSPVRWSCNGCATVNDIDLVDCPGCEEGTRPDLKKPSAEL